MNMLKALMATAILSQSAQAAITIDGNDSDWTENDRLDSASSLAVSGYSLYGRYEDGQYKFLLKSDSKQIGEKTTFWLNTDEDMATGHQIFGFTGGAEYNVNIYSDGQPYLYSGAASQNYITGPLEHAVVANGAGSTIEFTIPETLMGSPTASSVQVLVDVNDSDFLPSYYSSTNYYDLKRDTTTVPVTPVDPVDPVDPVTTPITIDGNESDWSETDRLDNSSSVAVTGYKLYGRHEEGLYKFLLKSDSKQISAATTFWLNTDQNDTTGYQIFGAVGGAEYNVNLSTDGLPYLYSGSAGQTYISGPLDNAIVAQDSGSIIEFAVPEASIGSPTASEVQVLVDVNNIDFLPSYYSSTNVYAVARNTTDPVTPSVDPVDPNAIVIDGSESDWSTTDRLDTLSTVAVSGYNLYGRYENEAYKILLKSDTKQITAGTTIWLNTDQDESTGYQIFGSLGGEEYNINIHSDGQPYLYSGGAAETYITGPLEHAIVEKDGGSILELSIPEASIGTPTASSLHLLLDVNNADFMPSFYASNTHYTLKRESTTVITPSLPSSDRRIGIVYSQATSDNFWSAKSYSQLYMSVQAQAMMAGIPFDLLQESDLLDLSTLIKYDTLVFPYNANVTSANSSAVEENLTLASSVYGVGMITAGNFLTSNETGGALAGDAYARMKALLGVTRESGAGPANISVNAQPSTLGVLPASLYSLNDELLTYTAGYTDYFMSSGNLAVEAIATQNIDGVGVKNAVLASQLVGSDSGKVARNAHFASVLFMGDSNLLWSVLRWSVYGDETPATLQMGREKALFISRNDMDQSMFIDQVKDVEETLLDILKDWKAQYNFVGSYYINEGNNTAGGEYTDWTYARSLYDQYIALGNEIGTHSYTHPHDTNILTDAEIKTEFDDHQLILKDKMGLATVGAAVPGAPEDFRTAKEIIQYVSYLTGGYSASGAGFPNAIGYLSPAFDKVYFSPNMSFDFTNVEFLGLTAEVSKQKSLDELDGLFNRAAMPIVHWPWHDYGPTDSSGTGYTRDMFESVIVKAKAYGSEFVTGDDMRTRIETFKKASLEVDQVSDTRIDFNVIGSNIGRFAVNVDVAESQKIQSVSGWYAYSDDKVFMKENGGVYSVTLGAAQDSVTRIYNLPSRANLISLTGDGEDLDFTFSGEGVVKILTKCNSLPTVTGADSVSFSAVNSTLVLAFSDIATHNVTVDMTCQ